MVVPWGVCDVAAAEKPELGRPLCPINGQGLWVLPLLSTLVFQDLEPIPNLLVMLQATPIITVCFYCFHLFWWRPRHKINVQPFYPPFLTCSLSGSANSLSFHFSWSLRFSKNHAPVKPHLGQISYSCSSTPLGRSFNQWCSLSTFSKWAIAITYSHKIFLKMWYYMKADRRTREIYYWSSTLRSIF